MGSKQMKRLRKALKYQNEQNNGMPEKLYFSKISKTDLNEDGTGKNLGIITDEKRRQYNMAKSYLKKGLIKLSNEAMKKPNDPADCNKEGQECLDCDCITDCQELNCEKQISSNCLHLLKNKL